MTLAATTYSPCLRRERRPVDDPGEDGNEGDPDRYADADEALPEDRHDDEREQEPGKASSTSITRITTPLDQFDA